MHLLTKENPKLQKGRHYGYVGFVLHLAPSNLSGFNVCPMATAACKASCLNIAGRGGMFTDKHTGNMAGSDIFAAIKTGELVNRVQAARLRKTRLFFANREYFMSLLVEDIHTAIAYAKRKKLIPTFRLNGTSDIRWEIIPVENYSSIMEMFPTVMFYDYTKIPNRRNIPANYHLTFSLSEDNDASATVALASGMNVAVVFKEMPYPDTFMGYKVINGDLYDMRFLDDSPCVVGLLAKGKAKRDTSGFVR